ncbi:GDSL esterase/lipase At5g14450-like [Hibiscus syriacus]|uniref:GDSL esterase/lipase At5g14450-like n=1 Tax=Hibiscus syriacus TaxID=106335 RepID=UPI0019205CEA|nr:GDSL esterase/lipase At5g14450-like [Hibiscus syriacus]
MIANAKNLGMADPLKPCCGYHVNYDHVWCGNKAIVNKTEVFGASCKNPSAFVSWDGVHYSQVANQYVADRTLNGSLSDPAIPITQACQKQ